MPPSSSRGMSGGVARWVLLRGQMMSAMSRSVLLEGQMMCRVALSAARWALLGGWVRRAHPQEW